MRQERRPEMRKRHEDPQIQGFSEQLANAKRVIKRDGFAAGVVIDGLAANMAEAWLKKQGKQVPGRENLLSNLGSMNESMALHLEFAVHAADIDARLMHCQNLFDMLFSKNR